MRAIAAAQQPSINVVTATAAAAERPELAPTAKRSTSRRKPFDEAGVQRPGGQRFGSLVHALLADMPLDAPIARTDRAAGLRSWARVRRRRRRDRCCG